MDPDGRCLDPIENGDIPASYVIVYQRVLNIDPNGTNEVVGGYHQHIWIWSDQNDYSMASNLPHFSGK